MTALKYEAIQLVEQMPEEQMPDIIQFMRRLSRGNFHRGEHSGNQTAVTPKMRVFQELEDMLTPVSQELDYDKELAEARNEKYGYFT